MSSARVVLIHSGDDEAGAQRLASRLGVEIVRPESTIPRQFDLFLDDGGLSINRHPANGSLPVRVDFTGGRAAWRMGQPELIARAVGAPRNLPLRVMDATAGLGRDAFVLASKGCEVMLYERHPVVHALLEDGLRRAAGHSATREHVARMSLVHGNAMTALDSGAPVQPDVVYIDPMFPPRRKRGLVKKEMQLFHALVAADPDSGELLALARARARQRVVVKRPRKGEPLGGETPDFSIAGRSTRFDVYIR